MSQEDYCRTSFCFLKKLYMTKKQVVNTLVSTYFGNHLIRHTIKIRRIKFETANPIICLISAF